MENTAIDFVHFTEHRNNPAKKKKDHRNTGSGNLLGVRRDIVLS
jgi:hypothetical protein